jgi:hypothetical protein
MPWLAADTWNEFGENDLVDMRDMLGKHRTALGRAAERLGRPQLVQVERQSHAEPEGD